MRHIERTKLLLHVLDITYRPQGEILDDFLTVERELAAYNPEIARKPRLVLINKMDLYGPHMRAEGELKRTLARIGFEALALSAQTGMGIDELKNWITNYYRRGYEQREQKGF